MRVSTNTFLNAPISEMLNREQNIADLQEKIGSGKSYKLSSEAPFQASRSLILKQAESITNRYNSNIILVDAKLAHTENTLSSMADILNNIKVRAIQANSGSVSPSDKKILSEEINENLKAFIGLSNTTDTNGEYIFSGFSVKDKPYGYDEGSYVYKGDKGIREIKVGPNLSIESNIPGTEVFNIKRAEDSSVDNIFNTIDKFSKLLESNTAVDTDFENILKDLDSSLNNITLSITRIGSKMNSMSNQKEINDSFLLRVKTEKQGIEELDFTSAISKLNTQTVALQASQKAYSNIARMSLFNYL